MFAEFVRGRHGIRVSRDRQGARVHHLTPGANSTAAIFRLGRIARGEMGNGSRCGVVAARESRILAHNKRSAPVAQSDRASDF